MVVAAGTWTLRGGAAHELAPMEGVAHLVLARLYPAARQLVRERGRETGCAPRYQTRLATVPIGVEPSPAEDHGARAGASAHPRERRVFACHAPPVSA